MKQRTLITGINGFAGFYLTCELLRQGGEVCGLDRRGRWAPAGRAGAEDLSAEALGGVHVVEDDLSSAERFGSILCKLQPTDIVHLAGMAFVMDSWKSPAAALEANTAATLRLLEGARDSGWQGRILLISSSDVYGQPAPERLPIDESFPTDPCNPYALSKLAAESFARFFQSERTQILIARPFNHIGPDQREDFVAPSFLRQILAARDEGRKTLSVGDLRSVRDFTDVRDVARAYALLLERGEPGEVYNICSGTPVTIETLLERALAMSGVSLKCEVDPARLRPEGADARYGSAAKLQQLGWRRQYDLDATLRDMWERIADAPLTRPGGRP